jgi:hypothetical protein
MDRRLGVNLVRTFDGFTLRALDRAGAIGTATAHGVIALPAALDVKLILVLCGHLGIPFDNLQHNTQRNLRNSNSRVDFKMQRELY